ncbi:hypothetical protein HRH25_09610 [Flavisolibacter sp. BT320]|nr:hypothetical protein [Flavisolibacter longurius]
MRIKGTMLGLFTLETIFKVMEVTAVVLHRGALAHYTVTLEGKDKFVARLLIYNGDPASTPPEQVQVERQGRHCIGNIEDEALLDELYYAAREKLR